MSSGQKNFFAFLRDQEEIKSDLYDILDDETRVVLEQVISSNFSLDDLRDFLDKNLELREDQKKLLFKFWKAHGRMIMEKIEKPVSNNTQGLKQIDWEINLTTHSRHQSNIQKKSATVLLQPREFQGSGDNRLLFEVSKQDVATILEKIDSVLN